MTTVTSGRCVPPAYGAFSANASPGCMSRAAPAQDLLHGLAHRAQVHGHVRRVGDELALRVEQRAGEIQALLDVHRARGVGERHAHLLGDGHEQIVEDLEQHRIGARRRRVSRRAAPVFVEHQVVERRCSVARQPRSMTTVVLRSQMTAGPRSRRPAAARRARRTACRARRRRRTPAAWRRALSAPARGANCARRGRDICAERPRRSHADGVDDDARAPARESR